ncbi:uncharacterized protein [Dermacentor andersoni]|uniref:uncharacterized protein n=1 Tax=Dermacentor andersoni TaxID=34620 RepID=UPI003B3AC1FB
MWWTIEVRHLEMPHKVKLLVICFVTKAWALQHHSAGNQGPGYAGYGSYGGSGGYGGYGGYNAATAGAPYQGYGTSSFPPQPYSFGYDTADEFGNRQFRSEQGDANNVKTGSYGYRDVNGLFRRVSYIADANGFRATVDTNEPGTAPGASADVVFNASPVVPPVPGGAQNTYGAGAGVPGYNAYAGFGGDGYGPSSSAAGAFGYGGYGRNGYPPNAPAISGHAYGGHAQQGYGAVGYAPGGYGPSGYGGLAAGHQGFRRRR